MTAIDFDAEVIPCTTLEEWETLWKGFASEFPDAGRIASYYHDGQASDFYKFMSVSHVIDYSHASGLESEARRSAKHATNKREKRCLRTMAWVCDHYPRPDDDDDAE